MNLLTIIKKNLRPIKTFFSGTPSEKSPEEKLSEIDCLMCDSTALNYIYPDQISDYLKSSTVNTKWNYLNETIKAIHLPEMTGGVNPGDQRAIFYLI